MHKQLYGCIDLGSNMCRTLIAIKNTRTPLGYNIIKSVSSTAKLGDNIKEEYISSKSLDRTISVLQNHASILNEYNLVSVEYVATAIFRFANNCVSVLDKIRETTNIQFRIIDPGEEIFLAARGCSDVMPSTLCIVIDMGGCSTEIALCQNYGNCDIEIKEWISLPYGIFSVQNLQEYPFLSTASHKILMEFIYRCKKYKSVIPILLCRSGVMTTLCTYMCKISYLDGTIMHGKIFTMPDVLIALQDLSSMSKKTLISQSFISNRKYLSKTRGSIIFIYNILKLMPSNILITANGGVREGIISMLCK